MNRKAHQHVGHRVGNRTNQPQQPEPYLGPILDSNFLFYTTNEGDPFDNLHQELATKAQIRWFVHFSTLNLFYMLLALV